MDQYDVVEINAMLAAHGENTVEAIELPLDTEGEDEVNIRYAIERLIVSTQNIPEEAES